MFTHLLTHSTLLTVSLWLGAFVPLLAEVLKQDKFGTRINSYIAAGVSAVVGLVTVLLSNGPITAGNIASTIILIYTVAVATYTGFWTKTGIAPAINAVTTIAPKITPAESERLVREWLAAEFTKPAKSAAPAVDALVEPEPEPAPRLITGDHPDWHESRA